MPRVKSTAASGTRYLQSDDSRDLVAEPMPLGNESERLRTLSCGGLDSWRWPIRRSERGWRSQDDKPLRLGREHAPQHDTNIDGRERERRAGRHQSTSVRSPRELAGRVLLVRRGPALRCSHAGHVRHVIAWRLRSRHGGFTCRRLRWSRHHAGKAAANPGKVGEQQGYEDGGDPASSTHVPQYKR